MTKPKAAGGRGKQRIAPKAKPKAAGGRGKQRLIPRKDK